VLYSLACVVSSRAVNVCIRFSLRHGISLSYSDPSLRRFIEDTRLLLKYIIYITGLWHQNYTFAVFIWTCMLFKCKLSIPTLTVKQVEYRKQGSLFLTPLIVVFPKWGL
jgi:hypothetical protein